MRGERSGRVARRSGRAILSRLALLGLSVVALTPGAGAQGTARPIPVEQIADAVGHLDNLVQTIMTETNIPGLAVAVVHQGKTLFAQGYGVRELGKPDLIDADTVFQIASLSKSVAASVVAHQVGKGVVSWDDPVRQHLPWFQLQDPWVSDHVSIGDFFAHRSGLPDHAGDDLDDLGYDRRYILERLHHLPLGSFRNSYAYTNFGLTAAAEAVAVASGMDWASLSENTIYAPLGMTSTNSRFEDFMGQENRAVGHTIADGQFKPLLQRMPDAQSPAGGVSSTVTDLSHWMIMMLSQGHFEGNVIIDESALIPALTPEVISQHSLSARDTPGFYGYGIGVGIRPSGRTMLSHSGAFLLGAGTNYMMLPSEELGIVVLTNGAPVGAAETLSAQFMDLAQYGEVQREWLTGYQAAFEPMAALLGALLGQERPADPEPSAELESLQGSYGSDYFGPSKIEIQDGALVLALGPAGQTFALKHWDREIFHFSILTENMPSGSISSLTFKMADDGRAKSFTVEFLNEFGLAVFNRQEH